MSIESVVPSNHLIFYCPLPLLLIFCNIRVFSSESALRIRWLKLLELQLQHQSFQWILKVDFLLDWLLWSCSPRDSQESWTPQFKSISSSALSLLCGPTLTSTHDYWKNHSFDCTDLCRESDVCFLICCPCLYGCCLQCTESTDIHFLIQVFSIIFWNTRMGSYDCTVPKWD